MDSYQTKPINKKARKHLRIASDDQNRLKEMYGHLEKLVEEFKPNAIAIETYAPFPGQMGGNAWKTAFAMQMACTFGWSVGLEPIMSRPGDIKKELLGEWRGAKTSVEKALYHRVSGAKEILSMMLKWKKEHAADAAAHALVGLKEVWLMRRLMGF